MLLGALIDAGASLGRLNSGLDALGLGLRVRVERVKRAGLAACKATVLYGDASADLAPQVPEHHHRGLREVRQLLEVPGLDQEIARRSLGVFDRLAAAEARVHGVTPDQVHFHEVGALDAIGDVVGTCLCLADLGVSQVLFSRLPTGGGTVRSAHGELPVPAPATMQLMHGLAVYDPGIRQEMVTPTGAALLTALGSQVQEWPAMTVESVGVGAGGRDTPRANVLRAVVGDVTVRESKGALSPEGWDREAIHVVETNLDDVSGQVVSAAIERLLDSGALDAWWAPCGMKKGRPGVHMTYLCREGDLERLAGLAFSELPTLGVRMHEVQRFVLKRSFERVTTPWGDVRIKIGTLGGAIVVASPEFEDCRKLAAVAGIPVRAVITGASAAAASAGIKIGS
jgi:hypothetical protein